MNRNIHGLASIFALIISLVIVAPVQAQDEVTERSEMIKTQNALRVFREFEYDSRHLYFIMSTAIISFEGGWFAREAALGLTYAENLREVGKNEYLPKSNRLLARLDSNKFLNDEEKARMSEVANQMLHLIELSNQIAAKLDVNDGDAANTQFREEAFPLFKSVWATNITLIGNAERRFPRR
jgi:hypothetical protein